MAAEFIGRTTSWSTLFSKAARKKGKKAGFEYGLPRLHILCPRAELAGKECLYDLRGTHNTAYFVVDKKADSLTLGKRYIGRGEYSSSLFTIYMQ